MALRFTHMAGFGMIVALAAPLIANAEGVIPNPYEKTHGVWTVSCSACDEDEETLSHCWIASADGGFALYPGRQDFGQKGDMKWFPVESVSGEVIEPEGNLSFTVDDMAPIIIGEDKTFFAALDGAFIIDEVEHEIYYDAILFNMKQGRSVSIEVSDQSSRQTGKQHVPAKKISLEGFTKALEDLAVQAPQYPRQPMCK